MKYLYCGDVCILVSSFLLLVVSLELKVIVDAVSLSGKT